jgi:alkylhydroperoxidase/carboxymuconolactone decarboxylase family protein YurZ
VGLADLRSLVEELVAEVAPGEGLSPLLRVLIGYGAAVSVTTLDMAAARRLAEEALDLGATPGQLQEVLTLVSGLGVHTLMEGSRGLAAVIEERGAAVPDLDEDRRELRARLLGTASYWDVFEQHVPGFLDVLLRLSPEAFEGFVAYGAIPARTRQLASVEKEVISFAMDAMPSHRYLPGLRLHLDNAIRLGIGRAALLEALDVAAATPAPPGVG